MPQSPASALPLSLLSAPVPSQSEQMRPPLELQLTEAFSGHSNQLSFSSFEFDILI